MRGFTGPYSSTKFGRIEDAHIQYMVVGVDWVHLRHVYSWNTLNNLLTQEPRAVIFAAHVHVLFDCGKFEMCASLHSEDIGKTFIRFKFHLVPSTMKSLLLFYDC